MSEEKKTGLRYNKGKLRYELIPGEADRLLAEVLTYGANKYTTYNDDGSIKVDGADNWRNGLSWRGVIASLKRHIADFECGEDFDYESGIKHIGHAMCNLAFLAEYYIIHPELDDRIKSKPKKIGLDIDEVLADWTGGWSELYGTDLRPRAWSFDYKNHERFLSDKLKLEELYSNLKPKISPDELPFEPHCYITSRSIDVQITKNWLELNGFPSSPVYSVPFGSSKIDVAKESGIDIFVDDSYKNFVELNEAGILTYLWDAPHNQRYNVGFKRIKSFKDLPY